MRHDRDAEAAGTASGTDRDSRSGPDRTDRRDGDRGGGDFRVVIDAALEALCERHELTYAQCSLLARLMLIANRFSGVVRGSRRYLAERLHVGPNRLAQLLHELDAAGVVRCDYRRGYEGSVTILGWTELVRPPGSRRPDANDQGVRQGSRQGHANDQDVRDRVAATRSPAGDRVADRVDSALDRVAATRSTCDSHSVSEDSVGPLARVTREDVGAADRVDHRLRLRVLPDLDVGPAEGEEWGCHSCGSTEHVRWWRVPDRHDWRYRWGTAVGYCPDCEPMGADDEVVEVAVRPCDACGLPACDISGLCAACIEARYLAVHA